MTDDGLQQRFYEMLMDSQWWSADRLRDFQRTQLAQLLRHAKKNVPFYEKRLDSVLKPNGDIDWDRWNEIPIVRRQDMVEHRDAMQARELPAGHGPVRTLASSGSTGVAISITTTAVSAIADRAFRWRAHRWHDLDWSQVMLNRMGSAANSDWFGAAEAMGTWGAVGHPATERGAMWSMDKFLPTQTFLDVLRSRHCSYFASGPTMAQISAREALRTGQKIEIDAILTQGAAVKQVDRDACLSAFGARMIEYYSSKEGGQIAHGCPSGRLHLNVEGALVEILKEDGTQCLPGETGQVVITPFYQTAQPRIRYDQTDLAIVGPPCDCGRHSPTLIGVVGRSTYVVYHPDGRAKIALLPPHTQELLGSQHLQVAQTGPTEFEVRYVPRDWTQLGDETAVEAMFRRMVFEDSGIRFVRLREMPLSRAGKFIEYLNEWKPSS